MNAAPAARKYKYGPFICDEKPDTRNYVGLGPRYNGPDLTENEPFVENGRVMFNLGQDVHEYVGCPVEILKYFKYTIAQLEELVERSPQYPQQHLSLKLENGEVSSLIDSR